MFSRLLYVSIMQWRIETCKRVSGSGSTIIVEIIVEKYKVADKNYGREIKIKRGLHDSVTLFK